MSAELRILVLQPDKGLAESICRALRTMRGLSAEVDVALTGEARLPGIRIERYDLLIVDRALAEREFGDRAAAEPAETGIPVISVGGSPNGTPRHRAELLRVPLPLSFNLLEESVRAALDGLPEEEPEEAPRQDSVG